MQESIKGLFRRSAIARVTRRAIGAPINKLAVVYTMGKVASSSYSTAISAAGVNCIDIHTLNEKLLRQWMKSSLESQTMPPPHICRAMENFHRARRRNHCLYITAVRDPVERNISAFFQNLDRFFPDPEKISSQDASDVFSVFERRYSHAFPLTWFDREMKTELEIDVFDYAFKPEKRTCLVDEANLAILRTDASDEQKSSALSELLRTPVHVSRMNVGADKQTGDLYKRALDAAKFSSDFLDDIYASRYCEHFWSAEERKALKEKWLGK